LTILFHDWEEKRGSKRRGWEGGGEGEEEEEEEGSVTAVCHILFYLEIHQYLESSFWVSVNLIVPRFHIVGVVQIFPSALQPLN